MGVYTKGMKMPSDCSVCPLETDYGTCGYYSFYVEAGHDSDYTKRRDDCPLIEVSTPHGRLIDADRLVRELKNIMSEDNPRFVELMYIIGQSTIIEEEGA